VSGWTNSWLEIKCRKCHDISDAKDLRTNLSFVICHKNMNFWENEKDVKMAFNILKGFFS